VSTHLKPLSSWENPCSSRAKKLAILVRLPPDLKTWIEQQAARNGASQNSEVVRSIRIRMDAEQARAAG